MSLKEMIEFWKKGVQEAEQGRHSEAIKSFLDMPEPGARIYFNIANMYVSLGNIEEAEKSLNICVKKDPNLAIGYFQRGCLHIVNRKYREAIGDFDLAIKNLRGNLLIDYKQLGLIYKLYTAEVLYNKAYCLWQISDRTESKRLLNEALQSAAECSESRHRVVSTALDQIKKGEDFLPYRLPKTAQIFVPPRSKTDVVNNIDFLGKAKVVSSVVDQDNFTGFVGAQKNKESRSPTPVKRDLPPHTSVTRSKSSEPPPKPNPPTTRKYSPPSAKDAKARPPKPSMAPPSFRHTSRSPNLSPSSEHSPANSRSPSPYGASAMTIKVHYTTTRAIRVASSITYNKLVHLICRKFDKPDNSITLWFKCSETGDRMQLTSEKTLVSACKVLEDGNRLTLWAYDATDTAATNGDANGVSTSPTGGASTGREVVAIGDYTAQYSDELTFSEGEIIQILKEVDDNWYHGVCQDKVGIFPKTYVRDH